MVFRVKAKVPFLPQTEIEAAANSLLARYEAQEGEIISPPVPIEFIAEDFLQFTLKWDELADDTLAFIDPNAWTICLNLSRSDYFDQIGQEFTVAHELGHFELNHFEEVPEQLPLGFSPDATQFLHREKEADEYRSHEFQAEYFGACLAVPRKLLLPLTQKYNIYHWRGIYKLADKFKVSATVMAKRLEELGLIYREGKNIYRNEQDAKGQTGYL